MTRYLSHAAVAALIMVSTSSYAGWNSGGGELFSDAKNPWFLANTSEVRYCIEIDQTNFGQSEAVAREKIKTAFGYWKSEFLRAHFIQASGIELRLATQSFVETECGDNTDVKFQLGTLTDEQVSYLRFPARTVGVAVRTSYNPRQLKGRGFVYISPESGPWALNGVGGLGTPIVPQRWQYASGKLLELVLIHEIGHIFGLQHLDDTVMDERAPSYFVSDLGMLFGSDDKVPHFLVSERKDDWHFRYAKNGFSEDVRVPFGIPEGDRWLELARSSEGALVLYSAPDRGGALTRLGEFQESGHSAVQYSRYGDLFLTPEQVVFDIDVPVGGKGLPFLIATQIMEHVTYKTIVKPAAQPMVLTFDEYGLETMATNEAGVINWGIFSMSNHFLTNDSDSERRPKAHFDVLLGHQAQRRIQINH